MARQGRPDTKADITWREANSQVLEQVAREHAARPTVTSINVQDELRWQATRIKKLMAEKGFK